MWCSRSQPLSLGTMLPGISGHLKKRSVLFRSWTTARSSGNFFGCLGVRFPGGRLDLLDDCRGEPQWKERKNGRKT